YKKIYGGGRGSAVERSLALPAGVTTPYSNRSQRASQSLHEAWRLAATHRRGRSPGKPLAACRTRTVEIARIRIERENLHAFVLPIRNSSGSGWMAGPQAG